MEGCLSKEYMSSSSSSITCDDFEKPLKGEGWPISDPVEQHPGRLGRLQALYGYPGPEFLVVDLSHLVQGLSHMAEHNHRNFLMDFVTDLIGYGDEDARTGQRLAEKLFYRTELFKALQIALRDVRNSQYDFEEERFIPSNRKGKRARVSDTSQGEGDENVSPRQQRQS